MPNYPPIVYGDLFVQLPVEMDLFPIGGGIICIKQDPFLSGLF